MNNICFIIAHKYVRGYPSYVKHYINNVKAAYGDEALVIITDNNSEHKDDIFDQLKDLEGVILLDNNIESKFELGGYQVGLQYVLDNNLTDKYEYYVFTQDTFIFKNKVDFKDLISRDIKACPIGSYPFDGDIREVWAPVLESLGLLDNIDKITFVWANSFIVHTTKVEQLQGYLKRIKTTCKLHSQGAERFLARIMFELNEHGENTNIDGDIRLLPANHYDCWKVNPYDPATTHFVKTVQQKNEGTQEPGQPQGDFIGA